MILDVAMPLLNGIDAAAQILKDNSKIGIIILTMHADEGYLMRALGAGVKGYLLKESAEQDIRGAVQAVAQGKPFFSPAVTQTLLEDYVRVLKQEGLSDTYELLTNREREVLQLLAEGKTNKDVASLLNLSLYTVESHRTNLMQKLNLHNTAEIVLYAVRKNIVR
jgi:two-component system, NarL family, response regulator NreC